MPFWPFCDVYSISKFSANISAGSQGRTCRAPAQVWRAAGAMDNRLIEPAERGFGDYPGRVLGFRNRARPRAPAACVSLLRPGLADGAVTAQTTVWAPAPMATTAAAYESRSIELNHVDALLNTHTEPGTSSAGTFL